MIGRNKSPFAFATLSAAFLALSGEGECRAQLCNIFSRPAPQTAVTTYRPLYAPAPVMATTVNYMPYTAYRAVYMPTPITTLQPAPACNACGGATTVMRPVVSYAMRPQLVPYTTYQQVVATPVVAAPVMAAPACGCAAGALRSPLLQSRRLTRRLMRRRARLAPAFQVFRARRTWPRHCPLDSRYR